MTALRRPRFLGTGAATGVSAARFDALSPLRDAREDGHLRESAPSGGARDLPPVLPPTPKVAAVDPRVAMAVESLRATSLRLAEQARLDALEIGLLVARQILEREIQTDPRHLVALIRDSLTRLGEARQVTVRLCEQDLAQLGALPPEAFVGTARITVVGDAALEPGDCFVEGDVGSVEYRLRERLEEAGRLLRESLEPVGT